VSTAQNITTSSCPSQEYGKKQE